MPEPERDDNMYNANEIYEKMNALIESEGSQNKAASKIGISSGTISRIRNGTYEGNTEAILEKLAEYFEVKAVAAETYNEVEYADTYISAEICDIISVCQAKGSLAIACGDAGIGKTKAAAHYARNHSGAILVTINPCFTCSKSVLKLLADRLGAGMEKAQDELWRSIASKLSDGMVIIVDEAQHLTPKTIEVLRSFCDYFSDRGQTLGVCLIGNIETVHRFGGKSAAIAQIRNRTKMTRTYSTRSVKRDDIVKLFPPLSGDGHDMEIDFLFRLAQTPQAIRGAVNVYSNAYDNSDTSYNGLVAMAKHMDIAV